MAETEIALPPFRYCYLEQESGSAAAGGHDLEHLPNGGPWLAISFPIQGTGVVSCLNQENQLPVLLFRSHVTILLRLLGKLKTGDMRESLRNLSQINASPCLLG